MKKLSDIQRYKLRDTNGRNPIPLARYEVPRSFVYDRLYGVISCPMGAHPAVMSLLLAWHYGYNCGMEVAELLGLEYSHETADKFLTICGTAFRSSQGSHIEAWEPKNLEEWEIAIFNDVHFIKNHDLNAHTLA